MDAISASRRAARAEAASRVPTNRGVQLHGFLSYLIKCNLKDDSGNVFGYKGKQVRDNTLA